MVTLQVQIRVWLSTSTLRHSFATQVYTRALNRGPATVCSPADQMFGR